MVKLEQGKQYVWQTLRFTGWAGNDAIYDDQGNRNPGMDAYNVSDYFGDDGSYKGPDMYGVEPTFERAAITICGNWRKGGPENEWAGSGYVDQYGAVECAAELGDEAYDLIQEQIEAGDTDGEVTVHDAEQDRDITYSWSIDN